MDWTNKDTKDVIDRPEDWDNPKDNFTKITREERCISGEVEDVWNEGTQTWDIDSNSDLNYDNKQNAIQAFIDSPFNDVTIETAHTYIDNRVPPTGATEEINGILKLEADMLIGLREVIENIIQ